MLRQKDRSMYVLRTAALALLVLSLVIASVQRNAVWHSLLSLWTDCAKKSPGKSRTHNNVGNCYVLLGKHFPAIAEYQRAVELDAENMQAQYNLAVQLDNVGLASKAMQSYDIFCRKAPPVFSEEKVLSCKRVQEYLREAAEQSSGK